MFNALFDLSAIFQYVAISLIVGIAVTVILLTAPYIAITFLNAVLIGFAAAGITFVACLIGFGGKGIDGGKGDGEGKGSSEYVTEQKQDLQKKPDSKESPKPEDNIKIEEKTLLLTIDGNNFLFNDQIKSFEEIEILIKEKISGNKIDKIIFYFKSGYKAKALMQTRELNKKYNTDHIVFDKQFEDEKK
ncbi:MAG: hypothetical protein K8R67_10495 [Desulfobacteraceae bacterium]|nr:hypothetical protein [Desulfobacteraceae bacterium]